MSSFRALAEVISERGVFCALYADRGSHYWHTPEAGGKVDKDNPTQVGRALAALRIELIAAYSPEARGRSERMFGTLQGRLPQALREAGITTMEEANRDRAGGLHPRAQRPLPGGRRPNRARRSPPARRHSRGRPLHPGKARRR
ncbi:MAG: hypothetical protein IPM60_02295 [Rhodospirillales bacterium]|nr:hypothetical protein [Rhodospirillales bacterium]